MSQQTDIEAVIRAETLACAYKKKQDKGFMGFFTPQRKLEPQCEIEARQRHSAELKAAQNITYQGDAVLQQAFKEQIGQGLDPDTIKLVVIALIAVIIIAWLFS